MAACPGACPLHSGQAPQSQLWVSLPTGPWPGLSLADPQQPCQPHHSSVVSTRGARVPQPPTRQGVGEITSTGRMATRAEADSMRVGAARRQPVRAGGGGARAAR